MKRRSVVAALLIVGIAIAGVTARAFLRAQALEIDNIHWQGYPLPPCFLDAVHCGGHLLGSDEDARDLFARLVVGAGYTLEIALLALAIEIAVAALFAKLIRSLRLIREPFLVIVEALSAIPRLPLVLVLGLVMYWLARPFSDSPVAIAAVLAAVFVPNAVKALAQPLRANHLARRFCADLASIVLLGATVDMFGYGLQPPYPSWGNMLVNSQAYFETAWWSSVFPAVCIFLVVLLIDVVRRGIADSTA